MKGLSHNNFKIYRGNKNLKFSKEHVTKKNVFAVGVWSHPCISQIICI